MIKNNVQNGTNISSVADQRSIISGTASD
ncbi:unnamed protein product, partial [Allacma fusca]